MDRYISGEVLFYISSDFISHLILSSEISIFLVFRLNNFTCVVINKLFLFALK